MLRTALRNVLGHRLRLLTTGLLAARLFATGLFATGLLPTRLLAARLLTTTATTRRVVLVLGLRVFVSGASRLGEHDDTPHGLGDGRSISGIGARQSSHTDGADDDAQSSRSTHAAMARESIRLHFPPRTVEGPSFRNGQWSP